MKALNFFWTSRATISDTQYHTPEYPDLQLHCCGTSSSLMWNVFVS